jgi:hypothetical protein
VLENGGQKEVLNSFSFLILLASGIFIFSPYRKPSKSQIIFEELNPDKDSVNLDPDHGLLLHTGTRGCVLVPIVFNFAYNLTAFTM